MGARKREIPVVTNEVSEATESSALKKCDVEAFCSEAGNKGVGHKAVADTEADAENFGNHIKNERLVLSDFYANIWAGLLSM